MTRASLIRNIGKFGPMFGRFLRDAGRVLTLTWSISPGLVVVRLISSVLTGLLPLVEAYLAGLLIGVLVAVAAGTGEVRLAFLYLLLGVAAQLFGRGVRSLTAYYSNLYDDSFGRALERRVLEQVVRLDQSYYENGTFTSLVTKVRENLYSVQGFVGQSGELLSALISVAGGTVILASLNVWLLIIILVTILPLTVVEVRQNLAMSHFWDQSSDRWRLLGYLRWNLFGSLTSLKELKLYRAAEPFVERLDRTNAALESERLSILRAADLGRFGVEVLGRAVDAGIQIWLITRIVVTRGLFSVGDFQFYRGVIGAFAEGISSVAYSLNRLQGAFLYIGDYFKLMAYEPRVVLPDPGLRLSPTKVPTIEFQGVSFRYPGSRQPVLRDVSLTLEPGERLAIVGVNGAGKTTLLKLLLRLYDPTKGTILVDNTPLPQLNLQSWYDQLGFLFQDFGRYGPLSVRENVTLGRLREHRNTRRLNQSLAQADASSFVADLPENLDQVLDPSFQNGTELSGGQWQRLALARSFFRQSNILVLDEPTSAIDAAAEHSIFDHLFKIHKDKSMIIVSHRFSTVRRAHRILVLEHGRMVEYGTHAELMKRTGRYKELFELQAEGYRES